MSELATIPAPPPEVAEELAIVEAERALDERMSLPEWYILKMHQLDEADEKIKEQAKAMRKAIENHRKALAWKFGAEVRFQIDELIAAQGGKKKSVNLMTGKAGYRAANGKVNVHDRKALASWCVDHCQAALDLTVARTTPIVEHIEATGEVPPGVEFVAGGDVFFPRVNQAALPQEDGDE